MIAPTALFNVLQVLAVLGFVTSGVDAAGAPHRAVVRTPGNHKHLANRVKLAENLGLTEKKRGLIRRKADGSQCRVKGAAYSASTTSSATTTSTTSSNTPTSTASPSPSPNAQNAVADAAAPSSSSTAAAAAASPANNNAVSVGGSGSTGGWKNVGSKLGNAWPNGNWAQSGDPNYFGNYVGSKVSWYYTWSPFSVGSADSLGVEFVPMLWGPNQVSDWWGQQASWPSTVKNALFFNEPNQVGQCDISASDAVSYWMNNMVPVRSKGISLGGAATTSAPSGLQWIQDFQKYCTQYGNSAADCKMDFIPIHWYDVTPQNFQQYVQNFHSGSGNADLWITEYSCQNFNGGAQCSDSQTWQLHQDMASWFDSQDYIKRYSPFGVMKDMQGVNQDNALMNPDGSITSLGNWYIYSA